MHGMLLPDCRRCGAIVDRGRDMMYVLACPLQAGVASSQTIVIIDAQQFDRRTHQFMPAFISL